MLRLEFRSQKTGLPIQRRKFRRGIIVLHLLHRPDVFVQFLKLLPVFRIDPVRFGHMFMNLVQYIADFIHSHFL